VIFFLLFPAVLSHGGAASFKVKQTLPVDTGGYVSLGCVSDLDGDSRLDAVLWTFNENSFRIVERGASQWVHRQTFAESPTRAICGGDVDADGRTEFLSANHTTVTIREGTADNTYATLYQTTYGSYIENAVVGDSNGNGRKEFLVARETYPARVYVIEAAADDGHASIGSFTGNRLNCRVAGTADLDQDGATEIVFFEYTPQPHYTRLYESGFPISAVAGFAAAWIGDTDGNGRQEMIGPTSWNPWSDDLRVLESNGNNSFAEVLNVTGSYYHVGDIDNDGRTELYQITTGAGGHRNVIHFFARSGGVLKEVWDSGSAFQGSDDAITSVLAIGDTDQDGFPEVAVLQGELLHILEPLSRSLVIWLTRHSPGERPRQNGT
jgi:hypothetical protein